MKKIYSFVLLSMAFLILASNTYAGLVPCDMGKCTLCDLFKLINNVFIFFLVPNASINGGVPLAIAAAVLMVAIGGFMFIIGGESSIGQAKSLFKSVAIGLLLSYGAWLIINLFFMFLTGSNSWNKICQ